MQPPLVVLLPRAVVRLSLAFLQQFSLAAPDPLGSASKCSVFFQGVFKGRSADTEGHWSQAVTWRGQKRVPPYSCHWVQAVCRKCPVGQTKGTNPRTGGQRPKDRRPPLLFKLDLDGDMSEVRRRSSPLRGVGGRLVPFGLYVRLD